MAQGWAMSKSFECLWNHRQILECGVRWVQETDEAGRGGGSGQARSCRQGSGSSWLGVGERGTKQQNWLLTALIFFMKKLVHWKLAKTFQSFPAEPVTEPWKGTSTLA